MATRDSQGLQIALITMVIVSVLLFGSTFYFYSSSEGAKRSQEAAQQSQTAADTRYRSENFKVQYLKHILGAAPLAEAEFNAVKSSVITDDEIKAIDERFSQDMDTYYEGDQATRNYRDLPQHLILALRTKNVGFTGLAGDVNRLTDEKAQIEQAEKNRTQVAQTELQQTKDELADEQAKNKTQHEQISANQRAQAAKHEETLAALKQRAATAEDAKVKADARSAALQATISQQKDRIATLIDEPFETADGHVMWVNQTTGTVWINLGLSDGLRRQTTFSVYDKEAMNVAPTRAEDDEEGGAVRMSDAAKAKLEVTRVIDQHLSEARIVEDFPGDPILPGDQIFSPAWKPGRRVRFALVGFMDINDDRRSDRDLVRNIIKAGGGDIDAEVLDNGDVVGELAADTRYLVRGGPPPQLDKRKITNAYTAMLQDAEALGIQEINVQLLLDLMGYKPEVRTVPLGRGIGTGRVDQGPVKSGGGTPDSEEGEFRERRPPSRSEDSAF